MWQPVDLPLKSSPPIIQPLILQQVGDLLLYLPHILPDTQRSPLVNNLHRVQHGPLVSLLVKVLVSLLVKVHPLHHRTIRVVVLVEVLLVEISIIFLFMNLRMWKGSWMGWLFIVHFQSKPL